MSNDLSQSARRVQEALRSHGLACEVVELAKTTRSAKDAARAVGCQLGQIVKSLIFMGKKTNRPVFVAAGGENRVNEKLIGGYIDEAVKMADADFVRQKTGFAIGGVPPIGHTEKLSTFIDEDLFQYEEIWAAAGNPYAVFKLTPQELHQITDGKIVPVTQK